jgi:hypothetical protein
MPKEVTNRDSELSIRRWFAERVLELADAPNFDRLLDWTARRRADEGTNRGGRPHDDATLGILVDYGH